VSGSEVLARFASLTIMSYGTSISLERSQTCLIRQHRPRRVPVLKSGVSRYAWDRGIRETSMP